MVKKRYDVGYVTTTRHWTRQAAECYYLGCVCAKCSLPERYKSNCHMKSAVFYLVEQNIPMPAPLKKMRQDILEDNYTKDYYKETGRGYIIED